MENTFHEEYIDSILSDGNREYDQMIGNLAIVDIGIIEHIENNRSNIQSYNFFANQAMRYRDVEVMYIGGASGGFDVIPDGSLCLLVRPRTVIPQTQNNQTNMSVRPYHTSGMKAIPLCNAVSRDIHAGFDGTGNFTIYTDVYKVNFTPTSIVVFFNDIPIISLANGTANVDIAGILHCEIEENKIDFVQYDTQGKAQFSTSIDENGTKTIKAGAGDSEDDWNTTLVLQDEGEISVETKKDIEVKNDDVTISVKNDDKKVSVENGAGSIVLDGNGNTIKVTNGNNEIAMDGNAGTVKINNSGCKIEMGAADVTINGHLKVLQ